jgi:4-hydroxybutyryl-CoA dehydratase/vinylacetyl-CoA-Delta-isomerase
MHGGGSPDGAKLVIRFSTPFEKYASYAKALMGIDEDIQEPERR